MIMASAVFRQLADICSDVQDWPAATRHMEEYERLHSHIDHSVYSAMEVQKWHLVYRLHVRTAQSRRRYCEIAEIGPGELDNISAILNREGFFFVKDKTEGVKRDLLKK